MTPFAQWSSNRRFFAGFVLVQLLLFLPGLAAWNVSTAAAFFVASVFAEPTAEGIAWGVALAAVVLVLHR